MLYMVVISQQMHHSPVHQLSTPYAIKFPTHGKTFAKSQVQYKFGMCQIVALDQCQMEKLQGI